MVLVGMVPVGILLVGMGTAPPPATVQQWVCKRTDVLQIGFDYRDGFNYVVIPSHKIPGSTNVAIAGRWVFSAINHHGNNIILQSELHVVPKSKLVYCCRPSDFIYCQPTFVTFGTWLWNLCCEYPNGLCEVLCLVCVWTVCATAIWF